MRTRPNTCLSVSTRLVTISLWWNSVLHGAVDQSPSFSRMSRYTRWRNVYLRLPMLCARRGRRWHQSSSAKVLTFGYVCREVAAVWPDCISALSTNVWRLWICTILPECSISCINNCAITYLLCRTHYNMWNVFDFGCICGTDAQYQYTHQLSSPVREIWIVCVKHIFNID